jgi:hypothetical protein
MTYSRPERTTIGPECLTAVFGMGTGVATRVNSPASCIERSCEISLSYNLVGYEVAVYRVKLTSSEKTDNVAKRSAVSTG